MWCTPRHTAAGQCLRHLSVHMDDKSAAPSSQTKSWSWQPFPAPLCSQHTTAGKKNHSRDASQCKSCPEPAPGAHTLLPGAWMLEPGHRQMHSTGFSAKSGGSASLLPAKVACTQAEVFGHAPPPPAPGVVTA